MAGLDLMYPRLAPRLSGSYDLSSHSDGQQSLCLILLNSLGLSDNQIGTEGVTSKAGNEVVYEFAWILQQGIQITHELAGSFATLFDLGSRF